MPYSCSCLLHCGFVSQISTELLYFHFYPVIRYAEASSGDEDVDGDSKKEVSESNGESVIEEKEHDQQVGLGRNNTI